MRLPSLVDVPALTLLNPWAHLVAHEGKRVENRSWMPPELLDWFFIHAGKGWDDGACEFVNERFGIDVGEVQPSALVALARLAHGCAASRWSDTLRCRCGPWAFPGQCHWVFAEVLVLPEPVSCRGRQGLWRPDLAALEAVRAQLQEVPRG